MKEAPSSIYPVPPPTVTKWQACRMILAGHDFCIFTTKGKSAKQWRSVVEIDYGFKEPEDEATG